MPRSRPCKVDRHCNDTKFAKLGILTGVGACCNQIRAPSWARDAQTDQIVFAKRGTRPFDKSGYRLDKTPLTDRFYRSTAFNRPVTGRCKVGFTVWLAGWQNCFELKYLKYCRLTDLKTETLTARAITNHNCRGRACDRVVCLCALWGWDVELYLANIHCKRIYNIMIMCIFSIFVSLHWRAK